MDLNLLTTFLSVYRHRSITMAAEELDVSQPAISNAIKRLEAELDQALFVREGRGIVPTSFAISIAEKVEEPLNILSRVAEKNKTLNVYCTESLLPMLAGIENICLIEAPLDENQLFNALATQKIDIVIDVISSKRHALIEELLFEDEAICLTRHDHPRIKEELSFEQYFQEQHIALKAKRSDMSSIEFLSDKPIPKRKIAIETSSISSMLMLASCTDHIAAATRSLANALAPALQLTTHEIPLDLNPLPFRMLYHRRNLHDPLHRKVRDEIKQALPKPHS
ncbi:LysR family transcriptional regulator [Vibrio sp. RE86]|uniref:LysR family transcriptional regulator n=1 Tax=Vibrio sp. RE86 TaxID=2607605 RepID=UPI001493AD33|nr:LysR family transcriptional regulator [Vibrio sp. RE86]NOH80207.1 LysR family transcriptional regulator [Vibrio sp. RE86]